MCLKFFKNMKYTVFEQLPIIFELNMQHSNSRKTVAILNFIKHVFNYNIKKQLPKLYKNEKKKVI